MANEKTILLSGTEQEVKISGQNCDIRNDTVDIIYASRRSPVVAGEDGVISIPAGQAVELRDTCGTLYLLGTGSVALAAHDDTEPVFKCAPAGGGGGTIDAEARNAITALSGTVGTHTADYTIHLTAEKAIEAAATAISNPNLLINPHFAHPINQRGQTEYVFNNANVTVDGWRGIGGATITVNEDGVAVQGDGATNWAGIEQRIESPERFAGREFVFTACTIGTAGEKHNIIAATAYDGVDWRNDFISTGGEDIVTVSGAFPNDISKLRVVITSGNVASPTASLKPLWAKLELGTTATPFTPPDPATELVKCQRYYQLHTTGDIDPVDLRPSMATIKDIKERSDGNYEYIAEL